MAFSVLEIFSDSWCDYFFHYAVLAHEHFHKFTEHIITVMPLIGVLLTTLLCTSPISLIKNVHE
jgi:hypothetical protein